MADPEIPQKQPCMMELEAGEYWWCSCGRSKNQPFCDGSHAGTEFQPVPFTVTEAGPQYLCCCKHTRTPPYCDGSHSKL